VTVSSLPDLAGSPSALDSALSGEGGATPVGRFLQEVASDQVRGALRTCLPPSSGEAVLHLVRAKLKPGRKLTAEYDVALASGGDPRRVAVTWVVPGGAAPGPAPRAEAEARRRGVLAPFHRSWSGSADGRMTVSVSPVDGAFPQLVRWHDARHVRRALGTVLAAPDADVPEAAALRITTVRYRPGQRHVLRVAAGADGPVHYAKVYRDDAGRRAVEAADRIARAVAGSADVPRGVHVAADRVALWPEVRGTSLADAIGVTGYGAAEAVRAVGCALRLVHDAPPDGVPAGPDAPTQAAESLRTAQVVAALAPAVGDRLRRAVARALEVLSELPGEPPALTHGDVKCDNLVLDGAGGIHLLDFDRVGRADPAADIGKFLADLRWRTDDDGPTALDLGEAFVQGYGAADPARMARARAYEALLLVRMAARRVPLQDADWAFRVARGVGLAAATLDGEVPA
jgi:aminoglycoside phosphotransferase (APT) family kinase protein